MRWARLKNGGAATPVRVQFYAEAKELEMAAALLLDEGARLSRAAVLREVRRGFSSYGYAFELEGDSLLAGARDEIQDTAAAECRRLFPEAYE